MNQLTRVLQKLFFDEGARIVIWRDPHGEMAQEFADFDLASVEKAAVQNNEFALKYRLLRAQPKQKFLLYRPGPLLPDADNWLLDLELAHRTLDADKFALWLAEMGLGEKFVADLRPHAPFFNSKTRREQLQTKLDAADTTAHIRRKMLAVCAQTTADVDEIVQSLLAELAAGQDTKISLLRQCDLERILWQEMAQLYGYETALSVKDFALTLLKGVYEEDVHKARFPLAARARLFWRRWQDSATHQATYDQLAAEFAQTLNIQRDLERQAGYQSLLSVHVFAVVEQKILSELAKAIRQKTVGKEEVSRVVNERKTSHWYKRYEKAYLALETAAHLLGELASQSVSIPNLATGVRHYVQNWFQIDQLYRHFTAAVGDSRETNLLAGLQREIDDLYLNRFLLPLNNAWQQQVDGLTRWEIEGVMPQTAFFEQMVRPFVRQNKKIFVIISDALRYEVGEELLRRIRQENRYEGTLTHALTGLPSYTQLGMAALLPHQTLALEEKSWTVLVDGQRSGGTQPRAKILAQALDGRGTAVTADELLKMTSDESRQLTRTHDVLYVYHNVIDRVGDERDTEGEVFTAVETALVELVQLLKKLANANASNVLITADHGFLYQNQPLEESDYAAQEPVGGEVLKKNRRYVLGRWLVETSSFKKFTAAQVGLANEELEMLLPKSINRLRVQGAGSRYVHGGVAIQEVLVPILQINKKRKDDLDKVDVEILHSGHALITTGQLAVTLYQAQPMSDKVRPRRLRVGLYAKSGALISDSYELTFDATAASPRERERSLRLILTSRADEVNEQEVVLKLLEQEADTAHEKEYKTAVYTLRRSFTTDFDF